MAAKSSKRSRRREPEAARQSESGQWKDRLLRREMVPLEETVSLYEQNPLNPKIHPIQQQEATLGAIEELGWLSALKVNVRTNRFFDGHMRLGLALGHRQAQVPIEFYDLTPEEERLALLTLDATTAMSLPNLDSSRQLLSEIQTSNPRLLEMMADARERLGAVVMQAQSTQAAAAENDHQAYQERVNQQAAATATGESGSGDSASPVPLRVVQGYYKPDAYERMMTVLQSIADGFGVHNATDALRCAVLLYDRIITHPSIPLAAVVACRELVLEELKQDGTVSGIAAEE